MKKLLLLSLIALVIYSCDDNVDTPIRILVDDIRLDKSEINMHYDESDSLTLTFLPIDADSFPEINWTNSDDHVATFNKNTMVITGKKIGSTTLTVQSSDGSLSDQCTITISPIIEWYREPMLDYNATKVGVKSYETRQLIEETTNTLIYEDTLPGVSLVTYIFDESIFIGSIVFIELLFGDSLLTYLDERYEFVGYDGEIILFKDNIKSAIVLEWSSDYDRWLVIYLEDTESKSINSMTKIKSILKSNYNLNKMQD